MSPVPSDLPPGVESYMIPGNERESAVERAGGELTGARWSHAARCPRMAALDLAGARPEPMSDRQLGFLERGRDVEDVYVRKLREEYAGRIVEQTPVEWGDGWSAHPDLFLPDARQGAGELIEVKSTVAYESLPGSPVVLGDGTETSSAVVQVVGAAVFMARGLRETPTPRVATISPSHYGRHLFPVELRPALVQFVLDAERQVQVTAATGELPARTCSTPGDGVGKMCPYVTDCFADWEPPDPVALDRSLAVFAAGASGLDDEIRDLKQRLDELDEERAALRLKLRPYCPPGEERVIQVDGLTWLAKRIEVRGRRTLSLSDAAKAGADLSPLDAFIRQGEPHDRWTISLLDDEA